MKLILEDAICSEITPSHEKQDGKLRIYAVNLLHKGFPHVGTASWTLVELHPLIALAVRGLHCNQVPLESSEALVMRLVAAHPNLMMYMDLPQVCLPTEISRVYFRLPCQILCTEPHGRRTEPEPETGSVRTVSNQKQTQDSQTVFQEPEPELSAKTDLNAEERHLPQRNRTVRIEKQKHLNNYMHKV